MRPRRPPVRHSAAPDPAPRRRIRRWIGGAAVLAVAAVAVVVAGTSWRVLSTLSDNAVARPDAASGATAPTAPEWEGPVDLLVMGSDTRVGQLSARDGEDATAGARSDVMMLLHVSADHGQATLVSIPRDTMMPRPECTEKDGTAVAAASAAQINAALDIGPHCSLDAVRQLSGLDLQHFLVVDFDGVVGVTDAIGGVEVCVAEDVHDPYSGLSLTAGEHSIQGEEALAFLRTRHGFADGSDLGRIAAQQGFLASLARTVTSAGTLANPVAVVSLAEAASRSISVDEALADPEALVGLAGTLADIDLERMVLVQLPVVPWTGDANRVQPDADRAEALFAALRSDLPVSIDEPGPASEEERAPEEAEAGPEEETAEPTVEPPRELQGQTAAETTCAS